MKRLAAAVLLLLPGCGTFTNFIPLGHYTPQRRVYGGVRQDVETLGSGTLDAWLYPCLIIDLPLSAVGDTLTLPLLLLSPRPDPRPQDEPAPSRGVFVFRLAENEKSEEVRIFARALPGVLEAETGPVAEDRARSFVRLRFDPSLTDRAALVSRLRERTDLRWWECTSCGRTAPAPGDCCLGPMRPGSP